MNAEAVIAVSAAVTTLTQLAKWAGLPTKYAPMAVLLFSIVGVAVWAYSQAVMDRSMLFSYFAGVLAVAISALGIYGFTRNAPVLPEPEKNLTATRLVVKE